MAQWLPYPDVHCEFFVEYSLIVSMYLYVFVRKLCSFLVCMLDRFTIQILSVFSLDVSFGSSRHIEFKSLSTASWVSPTCMYHNFDYRSIPCSAQQEAQD